MHDENFHPYHSTPVQGLLPEDFHQRIQFCNWLLEQNVDDDRFIKNILWTDELQFTRDGITNFHNFHTWAEKNPHQIKQTSFQHRLSLNVWAGVIGNALIRPFVLPPRLNSTTYLEFLQNDLTDLLDDVPLMQRNMLFFNMMGLHVTIVEQSRTG